MAETKNILTLKGKEELEKKLDQLVNIDQPKAFEELNFARGQGDLSENSDYDAAREKTEKIKAEISRITYMLDHSTIVDEPLDTTVVSVGAKTILVIRMDNKKTFSFSLVGAQEADPLNNKISTDSPVGKAIVGHKVGEICSVDAVKPYKLKIVSIE